MRPKAGTNRLRPDGGVFPIVIAKEQTFVFQTEGDTLPLEREIVGHPITSDQRRPATVFAFDDIAKFVFGSADWRQVQSIDWRAQDLVIGNLREAL